MEEYCYYVPPLQNENWPICSIISPPFPHPKLFIFVIVEFFRYFPNEFVLPIVIAINDYSFTSCHIVQLIVGDASFRILEMSLVS